MCNQRDATLPATVTAFSNPSRLGPWLTNSGTELQLGTLLREIFVVPALRRLRSDRPARARDRARERGQSRSNPR